jgi:acyl-CoA thioester hydrolase
VKEFLWPVRVYYEDTDSGGVVYYANYLKFMERARTEWLRARGIEQDSLIEQEGVIFAVRSVQVDYLSPARFNQLLNVSAEVTRPGKASFTFHQKITLATANTETNHSTSMQPAAENDATLLCEGCIKIACIDVKSLRPRPIPAGLGLFEGESS